MAKEIVNGKELNVLNLIIKQVYFDAILDGSKTEEIREVKPTNYKKLIEVSPNDDLYCDDDGNYIPLKYDALRLYVGYAKERDTALVEVKDAEHLYLYYEGEDEPISYEWGEDELWYASQITYKLGKVISFERKAKSKAKA